MATIVWKEKDKESEGERTGDCEVTELVGKCCKDECVGVAQSKRELRERWEHNCHWVLINFISTLRLMDELTPTLLAAVSKSV